jgi:crotonobetainyl-CoA:carnitine CoA-transferase CaiB-like acyl-CoA transferase
LVYYYRKKEDSRGTGQRIFTEESMEKNDPVLLPKERKSALAGVACGPIQTLDQVFADPQVQRAGLVHEKSTENSGKVKVLGMPVFRSQAPPSVRTPAADPGAHTREVLAPLGYSHGDVDALAAAGVIEVTP